MKDYGAIARWQIKADKHRDAERRRESSGAVAIGGSDPRWGRFYEWLLEQAA